MNVLVTGGAGFIGRWIVKELLDKGEQVYVLDDLSNGDKSNLEEFETNPNFKGLIEGDITDKETVRKAFENKFDICIHNAAQINVQESLEDPDKSFKVNVLGTYNILEEAKKQSTKVVLIGTCMVYDTVTSKAIDESHSVKPASPYAATKLCAEYLATSYQYAHELPVVILRPFNVYGPFQKSNMEGGVVSIFIKNELEGKDLNIFGDGEQTRDLLYVEDCADFIVKACFSEKAVGQIINCGLGKDISINELAGIVCKDKGRIKHIEHHHPQSEIQKLLCDYSKAKELLDWEPRTALEEGIEKTKEWLKNE
jgi:nucleoside-diphosphate-sugar epimerase